MWWTSKRPVHRQVGFSHLFPILCVKRFRSSDVNSGGGIGLLGARTASLPAEGSSSSSYTKPPNARLTFLTNHSRNARIRTRERTNTPTTTPTITRPNTGLSFHQSAINAYARSAMNARPIHNPGLTLLRRSAIRLFCERAVKAQLTGQIPHLRSLTIWPRAYMIPKLAPRHNTPPIILPLEPKSNPSISKNAPAPTRTISMILPEVPKRKSLTIGLPVSPGLLALCGRRVLLLPLVI